MGLMATLAPDVHGHSGGVAAGVGHARDIDAAASDSGIVGAVHLA